jgi:hypothetical protein
MPRKSWHVKRPLELLPTYLTTWKIDVGAGTWSQ